jgi:hypothetical protein
MVSIILTKSSSTLVVRTKTDEEGFFGRRYEGVTMHTENFGNFDTHLGFMWII